MDYFPNYSHNKPCKTSADLQPLILLGGFPEPFFSCSADLARRWSREHREFLLQEELKALEAVHDMGQLELLMLRLPELVGSPLSINSLTEDLQISHKTIARWLEILERIYAIFRVPPFGTPRLRAIKKSMKHYHFDWNVIPDAGARFENVVASHCLAFRAASYFCAKKNSRRGISAGRTSGGARE